MQKKQTTILTGYNNDRDVLHILDKANQWPLYVPGLKI